ncbi:hypothetical protein B0H13DRAFT_1924471 [Mycena leptocephala]|nr:hypothetical protein B0H13DRAFT_1924471 [Mycena leptocephala]
MPLDISVVESLIISLPSTICIFPNLQDLTTQTDSTLFPYLQFILGSRLKRISVEVLGPVWRLADLPFIASICQSLRHVDLYGPGEIDSKESASSFLVKLVNLEKIDVLFMNESAFRHISGLSGLEALTVRSVNSEPFPPKDLPLADPPFPSLQQLSLSTHSLTLPQISWPLAIPYNVPLQRLSITAQTSLTTIN